MRELQLLNLDGTVRRIPMSSDRMTLGRSTQNDLSFPEDPILSRNHLIFHREGWEWSVEDLGSKNGTVVNDEKIAGKRLLKLGDRILAGKLAFTYCEPGGSAAAAPVVFVDEVEQPTSSTIVIRLDRDLKDKPAALGAALAPDAITGASRSEALIRAGRELVGHRPLDELFQIIIQLAADAVGARRGALMTLENGGLLMRAAIGEGFQISTAVRDKVLTQRESLLVKDAGLDEILRSSKTIVQQRVRSLMAVPLQTDEKVIGLIYVDSPDFIRPFAQEDLSLLTVMANTAAIRIEHARLAEVEAAERIMSRDLDQAADIQKALLPRSAPSIPGLDIAGTSAPSRTVGGDYFDYPMLPDGRIAILVGDVAGKGLPAALMMIGLQARVQILSELETEPGAFVTRLNRGISQQCPSNRFITFFLAAYDPGTGEVSYANAGHNPPFIVRAQGRIEVLEGGGPPLGIIGRMRYQPARVQLEPGDTLVLYSDGLSEAMNEYGEEFTEERLSQLLIDLRGHSANDMINSILAALARFVGNAPANDDVTVVVARRTL